MTSKLNKSETARKSESQSQNPSLTSGKILGKRSAITENVDISLKRQKLSYEKLTSGSPGKDNSQPGITEDAVFRLLTHKPITTKELLKKFKTKKTGLSSEEIVNRVAKILKKLDPQKKVINGRMHLFLKAS